jgi:hypothetical protein
VFPGSVAGDAEEGAVGRKVDLEVGRGVDRGEDLNGNVEAGREVDRVADRKPHLKCNLSLIKIQASGARASQVFSLPAIARAYYARNPVASVELRQTI